MTFLLTLLIKRGSKKNLWGKKANHFPHHEIYDRILLRKSEQKRKKKYLAKERIKEGYLMAVEKYGLALNWTQKCILKQWLDAKFNL